jgi:hypothetical protein
MSSTLDPDDPGQGSLGDQGHATGRTTGSLGPSDSSDSGSDVAGAKRHEFDVDSELDNHALGTGAQEQDSDTDRTGTGERASADGDANLEPNADIEPDRIDDLREDEDGIQGE